jgi:hypothetical protein
MKTAYRPYQITIGMNRPADSPMVSLEIQKLELGENQSVKSISGNEYRVYKKLEKVATDCVEFNDPITGLSGKISVAGLNFILKSLANKWVAEELGCEVDSTTGWSINCK